MKRFITLLSFLAIAGFARAEDVHLNWICADEAHPTGGFQSCSHDRDAGLVNIHFTLAAGMADGNYGYSYTRDGGGGGSFNITVAGGVITSPNPVTVVNDGACTFVSGNRGVIHITGGADMHSAGDNDGYDLADGYHAFCCENGCSDVENHVQTVEVMVGTSGSPTPSPTPSPGCEWSLNVHARSQCPTGATRPVVFQVFIGGVPSHAGEMVVGTREFEFYVSGQSPAGTAVVLKIDGVVVVSKTVGCFGDPPPDNHWEFDGLVGSVCGATPTPTPAPPTPAPGATLTPTPNPLPTASLPPTAPPTSPPPSGSPHPGGGTPGNVHVTNTGDFYQPMKSALENAQTSIAPPPNQGQSGGALGDGTLPEGEELDRGHLDDLQGQLETVIDKKTGITDNLTEKLFGIETVFGTLNVDFGTVTSIDIDFSVFDGIARPGSGSGTDALTFPTVIALSPFASKLVIMRSALLWLLRILFWVKILGLFATQNPKGGSVPI